MAEPQILTIDASSAVAEIELWRGSTLVAAQRLVPARHCQTLISGLKQLLLETGLSWGDLAALAVNLGPGSFTGIRVALAAAKAMVYVGGQKLIGVDQFDAFAVNLVNLAIPRINVIVDGQMQSVSVVGYELVNGLPVRQELQSWPQAKLVSHLDLQVPLAGPAHRFALPANATWIEMKPQLGEVAQARLVRQQFDEPFALEPFYVRPSSAEEKWETRING